MMKNTKVWALMVLSISVGQLLQAQSLPVPEGRRIRDIITDNYPDGELLIGATTGSWGFTNPIGEIMDREFSYVTPENDFKHSVVRSNPEQWDWSKADAWLPHIVDHNQVLRIHGPVAPQCSKWAMEDTRTAEELSEELDTFMTALCQRYNGVEGILYLDVVNEIALSDGSWHGPRPGTDQWENPWFLIGQDNDPNKTPLYVKQAFAIANEYAPNLKQVLNNHCDPGTAGMETVKETILYLRERGYRVDGLGWQAHVDVGWATEANLQELRNVIDWCQERDLEFHITEFDAWVTNPYTQTLEKQAYTYKAIMDVLVEKLNGHTIGWNTWHISDAAGWQPEKTPAVFDDQYIPKPAYYSLQLALETKGDYTTPYEVTLQVKNSETGETVEGCEVKFNGNTGVTDENGELVFQSITAGRYTLDVTREQMDPLRKGISIYKDTLLPIWLDLSKYEVTYHVTDQMNGMAISAVEVTLDSLTQTTDLSGNAVFYKKTGACRAQFSKSGYADYGLEHDVVSDTTFDIQMKKTHGNIKFRLKNESVPVNGALVVLEYDTLVTNALGICIFDYFPLKNTYHYTVSKEHYYSLSGMLVLLQDTTIDQQFSRSVANVDFILDEESKSAINACAILKNDSVLFNVDGKARFYNIPLNVEYPYLIKSENYPDLTGNIFFEMDTLVVVSLINTMVQKTFDSRDIQIFPNPATNMLFIRSEKELSSMEIVNAMGVTVSIIRGPGKMLQTDISDLPSGNYWLIVEDTSGLKACYLQLLGF